MRLLIATPEYPPHAGGIASFYRALAPALVRAGCDVTVVTASPYSDAPPSYEHDGVQVRMVPRGEIDRLAIAMPQFSAAPAFRRWTAAARAAHDAARELSPFDVVEVTDFALAFVPFLLAADRARVVAQLHASVGQISLREPRRANLELDLALARLSEVMLLPQAQELQTYGSPNAIEWSDRLQRAVEMIPPPVPPSELPPASAGSEILVVARIQSWKGAELLCRALARVHPSLVPSIQWIGSDTDTAPDGGSLSAYLGRTYPSVWGTRIIPAGAMSHAEAVERIRRSSLVLVPSMWDVFNLTVAEAMAAARVVVCSDAAGASGWIETGVNGFVFRSGEDASLADVLARAASLPPGDAARIGERARATARACFAPDVVARTRLARYRALENATAQPAPPGADWIRSFYSGHETARVDSAFLDQLSVRELSKYLGRRLGDRVLGRRGAEAEPS